MSRDHSHCVVAGAGLAGLAAATSLASHGIRVTLLEQRSIPGGRASSFEAQGSPEVVDNCQHVLLGCCVNLMHFYRSIGVAEKIRWQRDILFQEPCGRVSSVGAAPLPAPFHLIPSFLRLKFLNRAEKWRLAAGLMRMLMSEGPGRDAPFSEWLTETGQPARVVERFWRPVVVSALNEEPELCSTRQAYRFFRSGFLGHPMASHMGVPAAPLRELYEPAVEQLRRQGAEVLFRSPLRSIERLPSGSLRLGLDGRSLDAEGLILAVPWERAADLAAPLLGGPAVEPWRRLRPSPIIGVHLWWDRQVTRLPSAALLDREVQWVFNKSTEASPAAGSHLGLVVSASRDWLALDRAEILRRAEHDVRSALPGTEGAAVTHSAVIKEARATYSPAPGAEELRPSHRTGVPNFWLAGDWVRSGWPATMEGAVRSGYLAAEAALQQFGRPARLLQPEMPWRSLIGRPPSGRT